MSVKDDGNQNPRSAKVIKLGFNISVSGDPGSDFEIVLDNNAEKAIQLSSENEIRSQSSDTGELDDLTSKASNFKLEEINIHEVSHVQSTNTLPKFKKNIKNMDPSESLKSDGAENAERKNSSIIDKIKSTMEHFEKFSDHIKEIPRLKNQPVATSTPFSDKQNSRSESSLVNAEFIPRKFAHLYDFQSRKEYFKSSVKPLPPNLFLKPLPGKHFYKKGMYSKYFDLEPFRHYGSDNSLNKASEYRSIWTKPKSDIDQYEVYNLPTEQPTGILKKSDSECLDRQSTSSTESIKDIKIYQSGGILIMQNFKENIDAVEKREISDFSAKLIENCNKLKEEITSFQMDKPFMGNSSDEIKNSGKTVQFDLTSIEGQKSKSIDSSCAALKDEASFVRLESSESTSDCPKIKDSSPQGTSQSQDLSLSTQENDSTISNQPGTSPTFVSPKKLEWDSGADIGYMNLDSTKEDLSTIERIVLKGLSNDGSRDKNVFEKKPEKKQSSRSNFIFKRVPPDLPPDLVIEEIDDDKKKKGIEHTSSGSYKDRELDKCVQRKSGGNKSKKTHEEGTEKKIGNETSKGEKHDLMCNTEKQGRQRNFILEECRVSPKKFAINKTEKIAAKEKRTTEKSVNVNTLWEDFRYEIPSCQSREGKVVEEIESYFKGGDPKFTLQRVKKLKKKKLSTQKTASLKDKRGSPTRRHLKSCSNTFHFGMGVPKKNYKNIKAVSTLNDELSKEVDEIIVDQRYSAQQKATEGVISEIHAENKKIPISASSSSNKTVLTKGVEENASLELKFIDQIIQTNNLDCESIGIQAFSSQVSSDREFKSFRTKEGTKNEKSNVNTSSKNIQAFGLNASLPKQLEHPKEAELSINHNTKSTQFFGGPVNSLPNYHSNLVIKPGETCGRAPQVLKAKKNLEAEIIRLKEENEKNILANDMPHLAEPRRESRRRARNENKENLINKISTNSKGSHSPPSQKTSKGNGTTSQGSYKKNSEQNKETGKELPSVEGSEGLHTSDEVSSMVLTSEVLKVHGDSIDRNIIQEKYFQSQLAQFQLGKMISRSTSMEIQTENNTACKKYLSMGCQYSTQSESTVNDKQSDYQNKKLSKEKSKCRERATQEQYHSSQNIADDCFETLKSTNGERGLETGDSLPSSTQTAHSWIPGMQNSRENISGVGKARSFEYLPGHIYESSGNLREELPSETEQNLITSSSDSDTAKRSPSDRAKESEGRNTLVLQNSTESSQDTDRLKILDENLTQLNFAVLKLREKDAEIQSITRSLLANLWKKNGSGDYLALGEGCISKTEVVNNKKEPSSNPKEQGDTFLGINREEEKKGSRGKEVSIACQTEEKSLSSTPEKFFEEKRTLEKRISEDKKCQIKWIENEIYHLNVLRGLLEKQNHTIQRKKKHLSMSLTSNDTSKNEGNHVENIPTEVYPPHPVTPIYGCTISVTENFLSKDQQYQSLPRETDQSSSQWRRVPPMEQHHYGLAVSLSGKDKTKSWRRVVMLPVGVQVSLKDTNISDNCIDEELDKEIASQSHRGLTPQYFTPENAMIQQNSFTHNKVSESGVNPNAERNSENFPSISVQTGFSPSGRCPNCNVENCVCINLEKSYSSLSRSSRSRTSERRGSSKLTSLSEEPEIENEDKTENGAASPTDNLKKSASNLFETNSKFKSSYDSNWKCQNVENKNSDFIDNKNKCKSKSIKNPKCRCQNCLIHVSSIVSKPEFSCSCPCQSSIYLNIDKPSSNSGTCHCSKIQAQKSSNSAFHIIKIHGAKCCSPGIGSCCCKSRTVAKKTENQASQTDFVFEDLTKHSKLLKQPETVESVPSDAIKKSEQTLNASASAHARSSSCGCGRKAEKEKAKSDDHPMHYFLRIEETEMDDDSSELVEQKKSLKVITVKVPVKKTRKTKIYSRESDHGKAKSIDFFPNCCNCCAECIAHRTKSAVEYESRRSNGYRRNIAEKPESPKRDSGAFSRQNECNSYKSADTYGGVSHRLKELNREFSLQEHYLDRNSVEFVQPESHPSEKCACESHTGTHSCNSCNCLKRNNTPGDFQEIQNEYESYKKSMDWDIREYCPGRSKRNSEKQQKPLQDTDLGGSSRVSNSKSKNSQQNSDREADRFNYDYYNYNKREFMTKSELLREQEQKQEIQQPSLQACLSSNRPDFYNSAERRRQIISERAKERVKRHNNRMECLINLIHRCNEDEKVRDTGPKRIFTTLQMREQTMKRYKRLPEVTGKIANQKKKEEYRTNKLMADIFAKKLQTEALKGHINLSNSVALLNTI